MSGTEQEPWVQFEDEKIARAYLAAAVGSVWYGDSGKESQLVEAGV